MLEISFSLIAFMTSAMTAVVGLGGGLILIALLPGFIPAATIIPVHAVVQLASNASRAAFAWRSVRWEFVLAFFAGALGGGALASQFIRAINLNYITLFIAAFILINVWLPQVFGWLSKIRGEFFSLGFIQTALGVVGGATGPLTHASLIRRDLKKDEIVTTTAIFIGITHLIKIVAYAFVGVSIVAHWKLMAGMSAGVIAGSWVGTHVRSKIDERMFRRVLDALLTLLALRMIYLTLAA